MFMVDVQSKTPIFEQLKKQILEFISIQVLAPNDQLPSVRSLAAQLGVNPNTVSKAYGELEAQGYLYMVKGKGCFVSDNQSASMIQDKKLAEFEEKVKEMKKYNLSKEALFTIIERQYEEEDHD